MVLDLAGAAQAGVTVGTAFQRGFAAQLANQFAQETFGDRRDLLAAQLEGVGLANEGSALSNQFARRTMGSRTATVGSQARLAKLQADRADRMNGIFAVIGEQLENNNNARKAMQAEFKDEFDTLTANAKLTGAERMRAHQTYMAFREQGLSQDQALDQTLGPQGVGALAQGIDFLGINRDDLFISPLASNVDPLELAQQAADQKFRDDRDEFLGRMHQTMASPVLQGAENIISLIEAAGDLPGVLEGQASRRPEARILSDPDGFTSGAFPELEPPLNLPPGLFDEDLEEGLLSREEEALLRALGIEL